MAFAACYVSVPIDNRRRRLERAGDGRGWMTKRLVALGLTLLACGPAAAQTTPPAAAAPAAPAAHAASDLASKLINVPGTTWTVYGPGQTNKRLETGGPQNYPAVHVAVTQKGKNAWDVGAVSPVAKPI